MFEDYGCVCPHCAGMEELQPMLAQWWKVALFFLVRLVLAPCVESLILLDRAIYLREIGMSLHCTHTPGPSNTHTHAHTMHVVNVFANACLHMYTHCTLLHMAPYPSLHTLHLLHMAPYPSLHTLHLLHMAPYPSLHTLHLLHMAPYPSLHTLHLLHMAPYPSLHTLSLHATISTSLHMRLQYVV